MVSLAEDSAFRSEGISRRELAVLLYLRTGAAAVIILLFGRMPVAICQTCSEDPRASSMPSAAASGESTGFDLLFRRA